MKNYILERKIPLIIHLIFIISLFYFPNEYIIYSNFIFYSALFIYFVARQEFSFKEWLNNAKRGSVFWKPVILTFIGFMISFIITMQLESTFPNLNSGIGVLRADNWLTLIVFALSTILLPPITEEMFYRKSLISFKNKWWLVGTTLIGTLLYATEHSLSLWGIFLVSIWAIPLNISYVKTKNVYIPMTAHFIGNLLSNGISVILVIINLLH